MKNRGESKSMLDQQLENKPSVIGKGRYRVSHFNIIYFLPKISQTPTAEMRDGNMAKKLCIKSKVGKLVTTAPMWKKWEVQSMEYVMHQNMHLASESKFHLKDSCAKKEKIEGELRRTSMLNDDC